MSKISVLHPTVRPKQAYETYQHWIDHAKYPDRVEYLIALDEGMDLEDRTSLNTIYLPPEIGCIHKLNEMAKVAKGDIFVGASDDVFACLDWDELIEQAIGDVTKPSVLAVEDGVAKVRRPELLHCFIVTRPWYEKRCYCLHPDFSHVYSDDFFTAEAQSENCIIKAPHILLEHRHPTHDIRTALDEHYVKCNTQDQYDKGKETFDRLMKEKNLEWKREPILT